MTGDKFFTFRSSSDLLNYASNAVNRLRNEEDKEDALQDAWGDLYESDISTIDEAKAIFNRAISRVGMRSIRASRRHVTYVDSKDYIDLGDGNYQRKSHIGSAD